MKIINLDVTDSTNEYCKSVDGGEDLCVIASRQTGGKGTKGRNFCSDEGGLYLSVMKHYENFSAEKAFKIMIDACVAVCKTLQGFKIIPVIRWANDVLVGGKKICGTLIENTFSCGNISRSIVGIGLNVNNALPGELSGIAASMKEVLNYEVPLKKVKSALLHNLLKQYSIDDYRGYINWFNKKVTIKKDGKEFEAVALSVTENGMLKVNRCGDIIEISSAEVSLRL